MSEHYYSKKPTVAHDQKQIDAVFWGKQFSFTTDAGVFSKNRVDFGTSLLINASHINDQSDVLDIGCGYGPIGITLSTLLTKGNVILSDINERAVELTKLNILQNQHLVNNMVNINVIHSDGFQHINHYLFDYIFLNPPIRAGKMLVFQLFEEAYDHLNEKGELWIVIQKKQGAPSAIEKLQNLFSHVEEINREKGYFILRSIK